jgi:hypothetical protein
MVSPELHQVPKPLASEATQKMVKAMPPVLAVETFAQPKVPTPGSVPSWYAAVRPQPLASAPQSGEG